jgi:hypothetical protein
LPAIAMIEEDEATTEVKEIYSDIKSTLGIDFVPNMYKLTARAGLPRGDERGLVGAPRCETPLRKVRGEQCEQPDRAPLPRLRCFYVSKGDRTVDEDRPLPDVAAPQRERGM